MSNNSTAVNQQIAPELTSRSQRVLQRINLREFIEGYGIKLEQRSHEFMGVCPFHEGGELSLHVEPGKARWHCGKCHAEGNAISFTMRCEGMDFECALRDLELYAQLESRKVRAEVQHAIA